MFLNSPPTHTHTSSSQLQVILLFYFGFFVWWLVFNPLHPISVPACAWEWGHPLMYRQPTRCHVLKKNDSSFPSSHQLWLCSPRGVRSHMPAPSPSMPERQPTWASKQNGCEFMSAMALSHPDNRLTAVPHDLWPLSIFHHHSLGVPEPSGEMW